MNEWKENLYTVAHLKAYKCMLNLPRLAENYKLKQNQWAKEKWSGLESVRSVRCCEDNCVLWQRCGLLSITLSISSHCQLREFEIARSAILIVDVLWQAMCWLNSLYFLFSCKYIHTHVYYSVFTGNVHVCVMPSSLHRRTQDTLVSSRPWCEQNWWQVKTVFSSPRRISRLAKTVSKISIANNLNLSPLLFTSLTRTRRVPCRRCN